MVNQQLLDFIKSQLLKGIDKETIAKELLGGGWTEQDIQEGFSATNSPVVSSVINPDISSNINNPILTQKTNYSGKKILLIIVALFVIAGGASGYYFRNDIPIIKDLVKTKIILPVNEIKQQENIQATIQKDEIIIPQQGQNIVETNPGQEPTQVIKVEDKNIISTAPVILEKTGPINCGAEMKCFMNAVKNCSPSLVEQTTTVDIFGIYSQTNKTKMTLTGYDSSKKCGYLSEVISANVDYNPEIKSTSEYKAGTSEQKNADLAGPNASAKSTIGMVTKCSFTTTYLSAILAIWSKGKYSSNDLTPGNCSAVDASGKVVTLYTGGSNNKKEAKFPGGESGTTVSTYTKPNNEIDLYLNKKTVFSDKNTSSSDLGFTLLEVKYDPSDEGGHDKIFKISVDKISTGESKIITYYDNDFDPNHQDSVFNIVIRSAGYSHISAMMNNGVEETKFIIQVSKQ